MTSRLQRHNIGRLLTKGRGLYAPSPERWLPAHRAAPTFARQSSGLRVGGLEGEWRVGDLKPARIGCGLYLKPAIMLFLALLAASAAFAQERADCRAFRSAILGSSVRYCVFLPASYSSPDAKARRYPVLYLLHGLGGNEREIALSGEWTLLQDLRRDHKAGDFLVVAPDGGATFYINSRDGKALYGDFFLREFIPFIERTYRVRTERAARGITGFSMGGYGALRIAFAHPELFGSVSAHSAAVMRDPPQGVNAGASSGNVAARLLTNVFGNPIDQKFWDLNSPFLLAKKNSAMLAKTKIYFDCGTEDSYGFNHGASELDQALNSFMVPHEFHLYPGGHSVSYLLTHREASFEFHWRVFNSTH
jgi:S-formylglutathione hydrolase FrmB